MTEPAAAIAQRFHSALSSPRLHPACLLSTPEKPTCVRPDGECQACDGRPGSKRWPEPTPAAKPKRQSLPPADLELVRAADRKRAKEYRDRKRTKRILEGWVPPEQRERKNSEARLRYFRERAKRLRESA